MSDTDEARELLEIAERELLSLGVMLDPRIASEVFGFVAQHAVEKCLKAWLCAVGVTYPFSHDLVELVALLADHGQSVADLPDIADLNPFAVEFRYSKSRIPRCLDREDTVRRVEQVLRRTDKVVNADAKPAR